MKLPRPTPEPGPILNYIEKDLSPGEKAEAYSRIRDLLDTTDGKFFLELLEKAVLLRLPPLGAPAWALEARHAQSFIGGDLRRIVDDFDNTENWLSQPVSSAGRARGRRDRKRPGTDD